MEWMLLPLKRYAEFSGRSRRKEYWMYQLGLIILYTLIVVLALALGGFGIMSGDPTALASAAGGAMIIMILYFLVVLALFIPSLAVLVRRLHDTDRSGWWVLAPIAPYLLVFAGAGMMAASPENAAAGGILSLIGGLGTLALGITLFVFTVLDGTRGPNRFGPDPKNPVSAEVFA